MLKQELANLKKSVVAGGQLNVTKLNLQNLNIYISFVVRKDFISK